MKSDLERRVEALQRAIRAGEDVVVDDEFEDLDRYPITLPSGRVLDNAAAAAYGREVADRLATRGRPSLTAPGEHSPKVSARVTPILKRRIADLAERDGKRPADVVRDALEEYLAAHG